MYLETVGLISFFTARFLRALKESNAPVMNLQEWDME